MTLNKVDTVSSFMSSVTLKEGDFDLDANNWGDSDSLSKS
jgi:hypothetical protein